MKTHETELQQIKDLLRNNPKGMKISRIAGELAMNRNACAKFIEILLMTGQVEQLEHGMSKIIILSRRTGIPTMLDRSGDFIIILDQSMKISRVNDNYLNFAGTKREALLGKSPGTTGLPVIGRLHLADKIREAHYGTDVRTEVQEIIGDREFFFDVRMTPTIFNDGAKGITIIMGDITQEKKKLASAADESRTLVEGVLSCIDDAVVLLEFRTGAVLFANPAAIRMFGSRQGEPRGNNPILVPEIAGILPGSACILKEAFSNHGYYETESRMKRNGSETFPAGLHFRPIYDTRGEVKNIVLVVRDLTRLYQDVRGTCTLSKDILPLPSGYSIGI